MDLYRDKLFIFTDGSKLPETGHTGATFFISHYEIAVKIRAVDHVSVYTVELLAILLALQWFEGNKHNQNVIIAYLLYLVFSLANHHVDKISYNRYLTCF